jgi:anaerobic ribonucleoside-triphosphate reductase activating protein
MPRISNSGIIVGGVSPLTTIDFPTVSSAFVVFCQGCFWRCPYCQNKRLQPARNSKLSWKNVFSDICKRAGFIEGVVFSGGEPLIQPALIEAIQQVREKNFKVAIHTSGAVPRTLAKVLPLVDWVGFDIKAPFDKYEKVTFYGNSGELAKTSLGILINSGVKFECRTTVYPKFLKQDDILEIARNLSEMGVKTYALQECYDSERTPMFSDCFAPDFLQKIEKYFQAFLVRKT